MFKESVQVVKEKDPAIKSTIEVLLYPSFWAVNNHRIAHSFYKNKMFFLSRLLSQTSRLLTGTSYSGVVPPPNAGISATTFNSFSSKGILFIVYPPP